MTPTRVLKTVLSVFIAYHLLTVLILPMGNGLVIRELGRYFIPYANVLGFNTSWQFFSPGPSPIFYLEYTYSYPPPAGNDDAFDESEAKLLPEKRTHFGVSDFYSRRLYSMRFLSLDANRLEKYMAPWLCRRDPRAESVTIRQVIAQIQSVERHRSDLGVERFADMAEAVNGQRSTFACARGEP